MKWSYLTPSRDPRVPLLKPEIHMKPTSKGICRLHKAQGELDQRWCEKMWAKSLWWGGEITFPPSDPQRQRDCPLNRLGGKRTFGSRGLAPHSEVSSLTIIWWWVIYRTSSFNDLESTKDNGMAEEKKSWFWQRKQYVSLKFEGGHLGEAKRNCRLHCSSVHGKSFFKLR